MKLLSDRIKVLKPKGSLSLLAGINRPVDPSHVTKIAESILSQGLTRPIVVANITFITGKSIPYIIDGQHLYFALMRNQLPIEYVEIEVKDYEDLVKKIAQQNSASKSWKMIDYVNAWAAVHTDYIKLRKYFNTFDFELGFLASVLSNRLSRSVGGFSNVVTIKKGTFKIIDEVLCIEYLNNLTDVLKIIPRMNRIENKYLCFEYIQFRKSISKYNHTMFLKNLEANKKSFQLATQEEDKLADLFKSLV